MKELLLDFSYQKYWVRAQLLIDRGGLKGGHFYCELLDVDQKGTQTAKMRAVIWRAEYQRIIKKLQQLGVNDILKNNSEVCVLCSVRFHDVYGLSLNIFDIDPTFGEAQIDRNRRMILEKLLAEGILGKNAEKSIRVDLLKIGLVTSKDSAAYNDFIRTLTHSPYSFKIVIAHSTMQGENTAAEVTAAINLLIRANVDVICIIRGGGSQTDLAWFDSEVMARAVINCPIPVWVGIGHEIDSVVLDHVAHTTFKTPTAVAEAILTRIQELDVRLKIAHNRLKETTDRITAKLELDLRRLSLQIFSSLKKYMNLLQSRNENYIHRTESKFTNLFNEYENILATKIHKIQIKSLEIIQVHNQFVAVNLNKLKSAFFNLQKNRVKSLGDTVTRLIPSLQKCIDVKQNALYRNVDGAQNGLRKHFDFAISNLINRFLKAKVEFMQRFIEKNHGLFRLLGSIEEACRLRIQNRAMELNTKQASLKSSFQLLYNRNMANIDAKTIRLSLAQQILKMKGKSLENKFNRIELKRFMNIINSYERSIMEKIRRLDMLNPENMLKRGYSITRDKNGTLIRSIKQIDIGLNVVTQYTDGKTESIITGKEE